MPQDVLGAMIDLFKDHQALFDLVGQNVFTPEHPADHAQAGDSPTTLEPALVFRFAAGSPPPASYVELEQQNIDVICYGESPKRADAVRRAAQEILRSTSRKTFNNVFFHDFVQITGAINLRDPQTKWPMVVMTWRFTASECPTP